MHLVTIGLLAALLGHSLQVQMEDTESDTALNDDGTLKCDGDCAQRVLYETALESASEAVKQTIVAHNATSWCSISGQDLWCPALIISPFADIADKAVSDLNAEINACGDLCVFEEAEEVKERAGRDAMIWAASLFSKITELPVNQTAATSLPESRTQNATSSSSTPTISTVTNIENEDGTPICDGVCARHTFYDTAIVSATKAVNETIHAYNATEWCINQTMWCPEIVNTTISVIAGKAAALVPVNPDKCDYYCLLYGSAKVAVWAGHDAMVRTSAIFNNTGMDVDETDVARLRQSMWDLEHQANETFNVDKRELAEAMTGNLSSPITQAAITNTDTRYITTTYSTNGPAVTSVPPKDQPASIQTITGNPPKGQPPQISTVTTSKEHHHHHDLGLGLGLGLGLPALGAGLGILGALKPAGKAVDPILSHADILPHLHNLFHSAGKVLPSHNWLKYLTEMSETVPQERTSFGRWKENIKHRPDYPPLPEGPPLDWSPANSILDNNAPFSIPGWNLMPNAQWPAFVPPMPPTPPTPPNPPPWFPPPELPIFNGEYYRALKHNPVTGLDEAQTLQEISIEDAYPWVEDAPLGHERFRPKTGSFNVESLVEQGYKPYVTFDKNGGVVKYNVEPWDGTYYNKPKVSWRLPQDVQVISGDWRPLGDEPGDDAALYNPDGSLALDPRGDPILLDRQTGVLNTVQPTFEHNAEYGKKIRFSDKVEYM